MHWIGLKIGGLLGVRGKCRRLIGVRGKCRRLVILHSIGLIGIQYKFRNVNKILIDGVIFIIESEVQ